ncbi:MAG: glycoside hydrolase family 3 protein [Ruminococcus sp.]|nr:glycoside hydrolase family 3 protein [Ruminococcus sp.]
MKVQKLMAMALSMSLVLCACAEKKQSSDEVSEEPSTEPVTEATEPTEPPAPEKTVPETLLEKMTLQEKVCQMFITTPEQLSGWDVVTLYDEIVEESIVNYPIGGMIMFSENLETTEQTTQLISDIQECAMNNNNGIGMFMSVDEEGGTVARVADSLGTTAFEDMVTYSDASDEHVSYEIGYTIGTDLKALGFNLDFAPVADVDISGASELGGRMFSSDPEIVATMASNVAVGLKDAGVCATLKHFPGLGAAEGNTHTDSDVTISRSLDDLRATEFVPFKKGIESGADFVMVGHQIISGVGDWLPSDLSYTVVTELLRNELSFNGLIVTDSQMMNTITDVYSAGEAAVMAVNAGVDIVLMPADLTEAIDSVCSAVESGEIGQSRIDESVLRILNKKYEMGLINENIATEPEEVPTEETTETSTEETTETTTETVTEAPVVTETVTQTVGGYVAGTFVNPNATTTTTTVEDYNYDYDNGYYDFGYGYDDGYYDYGYDDYGYSDDYYGW